MNWNNFQKEIKKDNKRLNEIYNNVLKVYSSESVHNAKGDKDGS